MAAVTLFQVMNSCFLIITISRAAPPPKSVNLAVETSFLFEPHDIRKNDTMLNNVRQFLDKLEYLLSPEGDREPTFKAINDINKNENAENVNVYGKNKNDNGKNRNDNGKNGHDSGKRLTKFLKDLGSIVINYDDEEVKSLALALNDEIAINPKFHDMFQDMPIKVFIKNTVQEWTTTDPMKLKVEIAKYITSEEGSAFVSFFHNLNPLFENDKAKLTKLVKKFVKATKKKQFAKPLARTFGLIFERYEKLDDVTKTMLREEISKLSKHVLVNFKHRLKNDTLYRRSSDDNLAGKDLSESVKQDFTNSDNSIENANGFAIGGNELRLDKNIQVSVHTNT